MRGKNVLSIIGMRKALCIVLIALLLGTFGFAGLVQDASAAPTNGTYLTRKWWPYLGSNPNNGIAWAKTYSAPLAGNLIGSNRLLEVVVVGGTSDGGTDGTVTVLNGSTGNIIWQKQYPSDGIGMHTLFELADLDHDGLSDIIVGAKYSTLAIHGSDGNVLWRNRDAPASETYPAIADIDGDGYPEIFVTRGLAIVNGYDWITELSHDGNILRQAYNWRTCYGGLTIGDTNFDGVFELYSADRSVSYTGTAESYVGGGMGVRALDPYTLTPLWNDPTILCSSQAPILADVDKNGILDVIVADQGNNGIAVLNSVDGTVVTTGGIYRKSGTDMPAHSQATVADIDEDGNLELIDNKLEGSFPIIWDLYDWRYDGVIPINMTEPPKLGDVANLTSNYAKMEIIASTWGKVYVYAFNKATQAYEQVDVVSNLSQPRPFTLVQDVDGDGLNELIVTSSAGYIYAFDTRAASPIPGIRSTNQFYSENRRGVAEYVAPLTPSQPVVRDEYPKDASVNAPTNPTLSIRATDFQNNPMTIELSTNASGSWQIIGTYTNQENGVYTQSTSNMDQHGTKYFWGVDVTDGTQETSRMFSFTTHSDIPTQGQPLLQMTSGDYVARNQSTSDADGDATTNVYNWYVNGDSFTNLQLPFSSRTTSNLLSPDTLFNDGFEGDFSNWNGNGVTDWILDSSQKHSGAYSAHAVSTSNFLTSDSIDTHVSEGITVSFWFRENGISYSDNVYLQFWNGSTYRNIFNLALVTPHSNWHFYSVQTFFPQYMNGNFRVRFNAVGLGTGDNLWIDDFSITTPTRTEDYSSYQNDATIHGATWTKDGVVGGAYSFDGINDFLRIPDTPSLGGDGTWSEITVEFWIKPGASMRNTPIIAKKVPYNDADTGSYMIGFRSDKANALYWGIDSTSSAWKVLKSSTTLSTGTWYHVVATYKSGDGMKIYINGALDTSTSLSGRIAPSPGESIYNAPLFIGWDGQSRLYPSSGQTPWLKGSLDEVRIYPSSLTVQQILQRYLESKDGLSSTSTIVSQEIAPGDDWKAEVTPNDSFADGTSQFTSPSVPPTQYHLTIQTQGNGTTSPAPGVWTYDAGKSVFVYAYPDQGWMLSQWSLNGTNVGAANPYVVTMNANYILTAIFAQTPNDLFSDGFESGDFSAWNGISVSSGEQAIVVNSFAYSGNYSARFTSNGNSLRENAFAYESVPSSVELYARGFLFVSASGIVDNDDRFYFIIFKAGADNVAYAGWRKVGGQIRWNLIARDGTGWVSAYSTSTPLMNAWTMVELHWLYSSSSGLAELYINGVLTVSISGRNTAAYGGVDQVRFGLSELYSCASTDIYGDDFKISKAYIGYTDPPVPITYNLLIETRGNGTINPTQGVWTFDAGTAVSVYAYPSANWMLGYFLLNNTNVGSSNPYILNMNGNYNLTAIFVEIPPDLFSDGFESGDFSAWSGTSASSGETATVVNSLAYSGNYSARFTSNGNSLRENAFAYESIPSSTELYACGSVYVGSSGITKTGDRFYFIIFMAGASPVAYAGWRMTGGYVRWNLLINAPGWPTAYSSWTPSPNQWYTVELHWVEGTSNGYAELYVDGILAISITGINTAAYGDVNQVRFGLPDINGNVPAVVYGDYFEISQTWIGYNDPPIASNLLITPASPRTNDDLTASYAYYDENGDPETGSEIRWYRNGVLVAGLNNMLTVPNNYTTKGDFWYFTIRPFDGEDFGDIQTSASVLIQDSPPTIDSYTPASTIVDISEGASINFTHACSDADNDTLFFRWLLNGTEQSTQQNWTLITNYEFAGTYNVTAIVSDGELSTVHQWIVNVSNVNRLPEASNLSISPSAPLTTDDLVASYTYSDPDGDPEAASEVRWYRNGLLVPELNNTLTVPYNLTTKGEPWNFTIRPSDGTSFGELKFASVVILNAAPTIDFYLPHNATLQKNEGDIVEFSHTSSDADNDTLTYQWLLDGSSSATSQNWTYTFDYSMAGTHNVTLIVSDGELSATRQWSVEVGDVNRPPSISSVTITPDPAYANSTLMATPNDPSDPDGDTVSYLYQWQRYVNGSWENISGATGGTLGPGNFSKGDLINVICTPYDGQDLGISREANITISNSPPEITSYNPTQNVTMFEGQSQTFSITCSDIDLDTLEVIWHVNYANGTLKPSSNATGTSYTFQPLAGDAGSYTVMVSVSDGEFITSREWTVYVEPSP